jgi:tetratricopeptide (TPR) repeat protein
MLAAMRRFVVLGLAIALAAPSLPARAQGRKPAGKTADRQRVRQARHAFEAGKKAYTAGDFDKAIELWKEAYELKDDPIFLYNIAQAYRQKGDSAKAVFYYKGYLRELPDAKNRGEVEEKVAELQKQIDDADRAAQPPPPPEPTPPPPAPVEAKAEAPVDQPAPGGASTPGAGMRVGGIVTMGVGAASLAAGIVFGLRAKSLASDLEDATRAGMPWSQDLADKESQGKTMNTLAIIGYGVGAAAIVTGGVLFYLGTRKDARAAAERAEIIPTVGPGGAQVTLRVTF